MFFQLNVCLNIHISQTGKITIAWHSRKNRKLIILRRQEVDDVIPQGLSRGNESSNCLSGDIYKVCQYSLSVKFVSTCMTSRHSCGVTSQC